MLILALGPCTPSLVTGSRYSDPTELPKLIIPSVIAFAILVVMVTAVIVYYCRKKRSLSDCVCDCVCCKRFYSRHRDATDVSAAGGRPKCDCVALTTHPGGGGPMEGQKAECPCVRYNSCLVGTTGENVSVWDHNPGGGDASSNDLSSTSTTSESSNTCIVTGNHGSKAARDAYTAGESSNTCIVTGSHGSKAVLDAYTAGRPLGKHAPIVRISNGRTHRNGEPLKSILKRKSQSQLYQGAEAAGLVSRQVALAVPVTDFPKGEEEEEEEVCPQCANKCQRCASKSKCLETDSSLQPDVPVATPGMERSVTTDSDHGTQTTPGYGSTLPV